MEHFSDPEMVDAEHDRLSPDRKFLERENVGNIYISTSPTNYRYEAHRIKSFLQAGWPTMPCSGYAVGCLDLARWGFYYAGSGDEARCVFCRLAVRGWELGDTAETEHRHWNPECAFLCLRDVGNVRLGETPSEDTLSTDMIRAVVRQNNALYDGLTVSSDRTTSAGVLLANPPKHPKYAAPAERLQTFATWPRSLHQRPQHLSEAGFYYTGSGDRVTCYHCGGGMKNWGPKDEPWVEHAIWFMHCPYLNLKKGTEFVSEIHRLKNSQNTQEVPPTSLDERWMKNLETSASMETEYTADDSRRLCKVCQNKELGITFLPCGHVQSCADCAPQLPTCPACGTRPTGCVRTFL